MTDPLWSRRKDYFILHDNITSKRITTFDNFCQAIPNVICNYYIMKMASG